MPNKKDIKIISASAGSGKTYRLMELVYQEVQLGLKAQGLIAVTFTKKAAEELQQRIREKLVEAGKCDTARTMASAKIGTVHSICGQLLQRFYYIDGSSPRQKIIDEVETQRMFETSLNETLTPHVLEQLYTMSKILSSDLPTLIDHIRRISILIRQNNLSQQAIQQSIQTSIDRITLITEKSKKSSNQTNLLKRIETFLTENLTHIDGTKATQKALDEVQYIAQKMKSESEKVTWYDWLKLTKLSPGKYSTSYFESIIECANSYISNPELKEDLESMIRLAFKIAQDVANNFATNKKRLGLLDYGDLEEKTLQLLDHTHVKQVLSSELDVLFVDEFQDTNPMQLAIFLKLNELCKKTVWVGDIKQSIFKFRGADASLMKSVLSNLGDQSAEILNSNWRSTPDIVNFVNTTFTKGFAIDKIPQSQIEQTSKWQHPTISPAFEVWDCNEKNMNEQYQRLALTIQNFMNDSISITDRMNFEQRSIVGSDIAVLCRTNDECTNLSNHLNLLGIESSVVNGTLCELPEVSFAIACYRYLINPKDTIAAAQIALALGVDSNTWLRMALEKQKPDQWHPILQEISNVRSTTDELSIVEKIELALQAAKVDHFIETLPKCEKRFFHLSALQLQAIQYEKLCSESFTPCTDEGFLTFLEESNPAVPATIQRNAINILTYHSSKGLEWPIVVLSSLHKEPFSGSFFDIRQELLKDSHFDANAPLANRIVTYLPWPFGAQKKAEAIEEKMIDLEEIKHFNFEEKAEARRLLYVGMTRAKERLIFVDNMAKRGLDYSTFSVLSNNGKSFIGFDREDCQITVEDKKFACFFRSVPNIDITSIEKVKSNKMQWKLPQRTFEKIIYPNLYLQPSHLTSQCHESLTNDVTVGKHLVWGSKLLIKKLTERADIIGSAIHLYFAVDRKLDTENAAQEILEKWNLQETIDPKNLMKVKEKFLELITEMWPHGKIYHEVPMQIQIADSIVRGSIDCLVIDDSQVAIIDHKVVIADAENMKEECEKYKLQLAAYRKAVEQRYPEKKVTTWLHNPNGWMCEVVNL